MKFNLTLPENHHIYTEDETQMFTNAVLYSYQIFQWEVSKYPDEIGIMDYIDKYQFHWLLALGKSDNHTIEYCRERAEKFSLELDKYIARSNYTDDTLPF